MSDRKTNDSSDLVRRLGRFESRGCTVVSCYLRLDLESRRRQRYLTALKSRIRELEREIAVRGLSPEERDSIATDLARIWSWVSEPTNLPTGPGIAIFASHADGLFEAIPLPRVHRTRIDIDRRPLLQELIDALELLAQYLAVAIDRAHARFFVVAARGTVELPGLPAIAKRGGRFRSDRRDAPGWGERDYHSRLEEEKHRHYAAVADEIGRLLRADSLGGIAVLGPEDHSAAMVQFLPTATRPRLLGRAKANPTAITPAQVAELVWGLVAARERADEAALLKTIETGLPVGWAVNGARETLRALAKGQVRTLVVPDGQRGGGFRCRDSGRLVLAKADCSGEGAPVPTPHLVDWAIDDALGQRAEVRVIDDPDLAGRIDGLAATLRFREEAETERSRRR